MTSPVKLRRYHAAVWDEPVIFDMGYPGRRGTVFTETDGADHAGKAEVADGEVIVVGEDLDEKRTGGCESVPR